MPHLTPDDPALFFAERIRAERHVSRPATWRQILAACEQRGVRVVVSNALVGAGYYIQHPLFDALIVVRHDVPPRVLAHELYHHLVRENEGYGILYTYPHWIEGDEEEAAERFAELLCGPETARKPDRLHSPPETAARPLPHA